MLWPWVRRNFLSSPLNVAQTLVVLVVAWLALPPLADWLILDATFAGRSAEACRGNSGACWAFVADRFDQFVYGFYPADQRWRCNAAFLLLLALAPPLLLPRFRRRLATIALFLLFFIPAAALLLRGGVLGLPLVETDRWGGLVVTLSIAVCGISLALPLGVLLAFGRRSGLMVVRTLSAAFVEFWRGVPLLPVLFMASTMLPLFLPPGMTVDKLVRAMVAVTLVASAYMAEVVKGGLQAIGPGQIEAARALGLGPVRINLLVVLPQALKHAIPGIVGTLIRLFKDSSLVMIVGIFDLLGIVQAATADPAWPDVLWEGYLFAGAVFWVFCFGMASYSHHLERRLAVPR